MDLDNVNNCQKMSENLSVLLKNLANLCLYIHKHSKDPESKLLAAILEELAKKNLQELVAVKQLLSKSDDELVNFLDPED